MEYLTACCTAKNEESLIGEWLAFHRAVGFDHLLVIDNGSTDRTAEVVASFRDQAHVTLERWDRPGTQLDMYNSVVERYRDRFHWCAFIDAEEFLYPTAPEDLKVVLSEYEDVAAVGVHWLIYGSSGYVDAQPGFATETYRRRAEDDHVINRHVKSIVKLGAARSAETSHFFNTDGPTVDENRVALPSRAPHGFFGDRPATQKRLRLNHYHTRSQADYLRKFNRGLFGASLGDDPARLAKFVAHDRNDVEDASATRYARLMRFYAEGLPPLSPR